MTRQFTRCAPRGDDGSLIIPAELVDRWTHQLETAFTDLTPSEQDSDREQVIDYLEVLHQHLARPDASIRPDLNNTTCSISNCFKVGDVVGWTTIQLDPLVGAVESESRQTIEFPLCVHHAHLLRMGGEMVEFNEGLA